MSSLKKNIVYQICYEVLIFILPLITAPYISRVLGASQLGVYSYSYSIVYYFQLFATLGLKYYGTRKIAESKNSPEVLNRAFTSITIFHTCLSIVMLILYVCYCLFLAGEYKEIALIQCFNIGAALLDINWLFFGLEKFKITVTRNTIIKILTAVLVFLFVKTREDLWKYTLIMSLGLFFSQLVVWGFAFKYVKFVKVTFREVINHFKPMLVLFVPIIATSILKYMDKIMLGVMSVDAEVGFYDNAYKIAEMPTALIIAFGTVMLPRISNLMSTGKSHISEQYNVISYRYLMCLAIGMSFGLYAIADDFAVIFFGQEFEKCGILIKIMAMGIPFTAYSNITRTQYLMPNNKDKIYMRSTVLGMFINLVINLILIVKFESVGVAIATLISEIAITLYQILAIQKEKNQIPYIKSFLFFIIPGIIMVLLIENVFKFLGISVVSLILEVLTGALIYIIVCVIYLHSCGELSVKRIISTVTRGKK